MASSNPSSTDAPGLPIPAAGHSSAGLEPLLAAVERHLEALGDALRARDARAIEAESGELHRALVRALDGFTLAARSGQIPPDLRTRLARASGQVVVNRECLARATAALDRAVDALMPRDAARIYGPQGSVNKLTQTGAYRA